MKLYVPDPAAEPRARGSVHNGRRTRGGGAAGRGEPRGRRQRVDTQGPGTLTVGAQDINTGNDAGGAITSSAANTANIRFNNNSTVTGFVGSTGTTFLNIAAGANGNTVTFNGPVYATTFTVTGSGTVNFNRGFTSNTGSTLDFAGDGFLNVGSGQTVKAALTNTAGATPRLDPQQRQHLRRRGGRGQRSEAGPGFRRQRPDHRAGEGRDL
uniref:Autotransporter domain-containing protein n=1 Tax=Phenylobacterium glaciei TaxID=2803784 RepID=A0A974P3X5_9CAUL|nr:hypothetical protein JKL49_05445 [Phenylobacterium glaciei]